MNHPHLCTVSSTGVDVQLPTDEDSDDHECYCDIVAAAPPARPSLNDADPPQYATPVAPCCPNNGDVDTDNMSEEGGDDKEAYRRVVNTTRGNGGKTALFY